MAEYTQAQAANPNTEAPAATPANEPQNLDAVSEHDLLARQLANPDWTPEVNAETTAPETISAGEEPRETSSDESAETPSPGDEAGTTEEDDEAEAGPESRDKGKRFRFTDPADRQFAALRKEGIAPDEAARIAYGIFHSPAEAPTATATMPSDELIAWQEQLAEIDQQLQGAGVGEGLMNAEIIALMQRRSDLTAEIRSETRLRQREAAAQQAREAEAEAEARAAQNAAAAVAVERFPAIEKPGTALRVEVDRLLGLYRGTEFLAGAEAPITLVEMAAANVAKAQAAANGTSFAAELARLDTSIPASRGTDAAGPAANVATARTVAARKIIPASGAQATLQPDQPATDADRYRDAQATLDPRAQHEALNRLLYGG